MNRYRLIVESDLNPTQYWLRVATLAHDEFRRLDLPMRDAIVLVPLLEHIQPARKAFCGLPGWLPRVETVSSCAMAAAPPRTKPPGSLVGDPGVDGAMALALLSRQSWARNLRNEDPKAFSHTAAALVKLAQEWQVAIGSRPPGGREAMIEHARALLQSNAGLGMFETALSRIALEWSALDCTRDADALALLTPSAWLIVEAGRGQDGLSTVLANPDAQVTFIGSLTPTQNPFDAMPMHRPLVMLADGPEDEACATANRVIEEVAAGHTPVAVVAEDRLLLRRVRALLERRSVGISDETGWSLATTRAAAWAMSSLRAAASQAGPDDWLDWLKNEAAGSLNPALDSLEWDWRRHGGADRASAGAEQPLWRQAQARLHAFVRPGSRSLAAWCAALSELLDGGAAAAQWSADDAGRRVRQVLSPQSIGSSDASEQILDLDDFVSWAGTALERARFVPPMPDKVHVVLTPLRRALLRPFASVVLPGADQRNLATDGGEASLIPEFVRAGLDLPDRNAQSAAAARDFIELLRSPRLMILRHREADGEANPASVWVQRMCALHRRRGGRALEGAPVQAHTAPVLARPVVPPQPSTAGWLPHQISATQIDSLRQCPYQFFARSALGLRESDDLDAVADKRDYGTWLHAILQRFHDTRHARDSAVVEVARLLKIADESSDEFTAQPVDLWPFRSGLSGWASRYIHWLHGRDALGWNYLVGEQDRTRPLPGLPLVVLRGRLDRIDQHQEADGTRVLQLLDYKTGRASSLKEKLVEPAEDTQLVFYAALALEDPVPLRAAYVALDDPSEVMELEHHDVALTAEALLDGLAREFIRVRDGAPLLALGTGTTCDRCEMRGLCRRDEWIASEAAVTEPGAA